MQFSTACEWLAFIKTINIHAIDLGLARVKEVAERMRLLPLQCPSIVVGGTNGKGSTVASAGKYLSRGRLAGWRLYVATVAASE